MDYVVLDKSGLDRAPAQFFDNLKDAQFAQSQKNANLLTTDFATFSLFELKTGE